MSVFVKGSGCENVTPEVTAQTPVISQILEGLVGKTQGANATADKILEGYSAYVGQELIEGTAKDASTMVDLLAATGCTKMAVDKFTFASGTALTTQVSHSLGQVPTLGFVYTSDEVENASPLPIKFHIASSNNGFLSYKRSDGTMFYSSSTSKIDTSNTTSDKLCFTSTNIYQAGLEYTLITMA